LSHRVRARLPRRRIGAIIGELADTWMAGEEGRLEGWIADAGQDTPAPLASVARNLRRDFGVVHNGLSLPHSSGAVEGTFDHQ
jgi:transposase